MKILMVMLAYVIILNMLFIASPALGLVLLIVSLAYIIEDGVN